MPVYADKPPGVFLAGIRQLGIVPYAHFGISMGGIAKLFNVSMVAVLKWIPRAAKGIPETDSTETPMVQVDEMWHFVNGKNLALARRLWAYTSCFGMACR